MLTLRALLLFLCLTPAVVFAHQINGTLRHANGRPVQDTVRINCPPPANVFIERRTDTRGGFSFFIEPTGRCTLTVGAASYPIYSSRNPVRYDLILDNNKLRRR